jgi:hypothetical protein
MPSVTYMMEHFFSSLSTLPRTITFANTFEKGLTALFFFTISVVLAVALILFGVGTEESFAQKNLNFVRDLTL